ncbi:MAG: THUMP domain-containing class I SAM-dependent RNA methyltransferase [Anaerolineae bacterium]
MSEMFVVCPGKIELLLMQELKELGIEKVRRGPRGVFVPKNMDLVYRINYLSRLATRVLWPLATFPCPNRDVLYREARKVPWIAFMDSNKTFAIDANVSFHPNLKNSLFAALVVKDAICDVLREKIGSRPSIDTAKPDIQLNLFIDEGQATLSFDTSGPPLYKRGWRQMAGMAPLQESLAAAILRIANVTSSDILCDPFCGSGTFLIEAAMCNSHTPAGFFRQFWGFMHHPAYRTSEWLKVKEMADKQKIKLETGKITGIDKDANILQTLKSHLKTTAFEEAIATKSQDIENYHPPQPPTIVVCNPPYGKRLQTSSELYRSIGTFLTSRCSKTVKAFILTENSRLIQATALPFKEKIQLKNGGLDVFLYELQLQN